MDEKKKAHTTPEERIELWADLVREVAPDLPVTTKRDFIKICQKAFEKNGFKDEYDNTFFVSYSYASKRWKQIVNAAAQGRDGTFVKYVNYHDGKRLRGEWRKVNKREYEKQMLVEAKDIVTRIENYNENKETGQSRWKSLGLPGFDVPQLPSGVK
jgi:hypothetical protein